jgi:hypothetical protein
MEYSSFHSPAELGESFRKDNRFNSLSIWLLKIANYPDTHIQNKNDLLSLVVDLFIWCFGYSCCNYDCVGIFQKNKIILNIPSEIP